MKKFQPANIGIIGAGAVGLRLAYFFKKKLPAHLILVNRPSMVSSRLLSAIEPDQTGTRYALVRNCSLVIVAAPDNQIETIARHLRRLRWTSKRVYLIHCSGSYSSDLLLPAKQNSSAKIIIGSMHPMQTFLSTPVHPDDLKQPELQTTTFGIEGNRMCLRFLQTFLDSLACRYIVIPKKYKMLYHIGGIFAGNFLTVLLEIVHRLYRTIGWDHAQTMQLLKPFLHTTIDNCTTYSPVRALTGPAARNDRGLIALHLKTLYDLDPRIADLYIYLSHYGMIMKGHLK